MRAPRSVYPHKKPVNKTLSSENTSETQAHEAALGESWGESRGPSPGRRGLMVSGTPATRPAPSGPLQALRQSRGEAGSIHRTLGRQSGTTANTVTRTGSYATLFAK